MSQRTNPTPVALYARVSSDRQDVDLSVSAQLRALRDFAEKNSRLPVLEYVDEAMSGRIANRPKFREMLDAAKGPTPPFQEILVWKLSRFTRKREDAVIFKAMLRRRGIKPRSTDETRLEGVAIVRSCAHSPLPQAAGEPRIPRNTRLIWLRERQGGAPLNLG